MAVDETLTIGEVAERTGVAIATLRAWELRHGFPVPQRLPSGHRRYAAADVATILDVLRRREAGVRLEVAITQARHQARGASGNRSVFAELRHAHPGLVVQRLTKPTLVALSWAIEDEVRARAERGLLFGAFQRRQHWLAARQRWGELARVARAAYVFADFEEPQVDGPLTLVPLPEDAPMRGEWLVLCDAPGLSVAMSGWELPGQDDVPDRERVFEATWTLDPVAVRGAARLCADVAELPELRAELAAEPPPPAVDAIAATGLFQRVVGYLDRGADGTVTAGRLG